MTSPLGRRKKERLRHRQAGLYAHHASCVDFLYQFPECHGTSRKVVRRVWEDTAEPGAVSPLGAIFMVFTIAFSYLLIYTFP